MPLSKLKFRPVASFERRVGFRVKPPGQTGRARKHHPPMNVKGLGPYHAKVVKTVRAFTGCTRTGKGEYAIVRHPDGTHAVWSRDENFGPLDMTRTQAFAEARFQMREFDREASHWHHRFDLRAEMERLIGLSSEEKRRSGRRMRNEYGDQWRKLGPTLCYSVDSEVCRFRRGGGVISIHLRDDIAAWCHEQEVPVILHHDLPFAMARRGGQVAPVYAFVLEFEQMHHAFWFKMRWNDEQIR